MLIQWQSRKGLQANEKGFTCSYLIGCFTYIISFGGFKHMTILGTVILTIICTLAVTYLIHELLEDNENSF